MLIDQMPGIVSVWSTRNCMYHHSLGNTVNMNRHLAASGNTTFRDHLRCSSIISIFFCNTKYRQQRRSEFLHGRCTLQQPHAGYFGTQLPPWWGCESWKSHTSGLPHPVGSLQKCLFASGQCMCFHCWLFSLHSCTQSD